MENPFPAESKTTAPNEPHQGAESELPHPTEAVLQKNEATPHQVPLHEQAPEQGDSGDRESENTFHPQELPLGESEAATHNDSGSDETGESSQESPATEAELIPFEKGSLEDFAARARKGRLSNEEETEATIVLKETLLGGRADVAQAVAATPFLPWIVSVQATTAAWPEMKASFRTQFLAGLARTQGEQAARIRLSLARGLFKVDQAAALKLILLTLKLLRNKETGLLEGKGPALFANVLIGRGKAWALQLPLQSLKPTEADLLVFAALHGAFHAPQAPIAQLSILKWAAAAERLTRLPEALETLILKGIARWSGKWQAALRKEVTSIPESWAETLKAVPQRTAPQQSRNQPERAERGERGAEEISDTPQEEDGTRAVHAGAPNGSPEEEREREEEDDDEQERDEDQDERDEREDERPPSQKQRPVYVSKTVPNHGAHPQQGRRGNGQQQFNLQDTLRQIDSYVAGLRNELQASQKQLRQREEDPRRGRRAERSAPDVVPGDLSTEELLRLNQQLESRNAELKTRLDELTIDSEERAASSGLLTDATPPDPSTQLRTLLGFKLKDDYEDFLALQQEARDLVVQQHYKTVLQHVFEVLLAEGVQLPAAGHSAGA